MYVSACIVRYECVERFSQIPCHTNDCSPSLISVFRRDFRINFDTYAFYPKEGRWHPRNRVIEKVLFAEKLSKDVGLENRKA